MGTNSRRTSAAVAALSAGLVLTTALAVDASGARRSDKLPPGTLRGLHDRLEQYPTVSLATRAQRAAAEDFLLALNGRTRHWRSPRLAAADGFSVRRDRRRPGDRSVLWFHSEHRRWHSDDSYADPEKPDTLIYADLPGRRLILVGVMFSMRRGMRGPSPGGPITRWHWHLVCADGRRRGQAPRRNGSCPRGSTLRAGSEMMHVWFTGDLRSAFAIHAPVPELCRARLLPAVRCHAHIH
jgi:hypothetical protein